MTVFHRLVKLALIAAALFVFASCDDDDENTVTPTPTVPELVIPDAYDDSNFSANTTDQQVTLDGLAALTNALKAGREEGVVLTEADLQAAFAPLESATLPAYKTLVDGWLVEAAKASGTTFDPNAEDRGEGGTWGGYLFDENGLELEQMVEKGMIGATLYNEAIVLMQGDITPATIDQLIALFGASPAFSNSDKAATDPDIFLAKYSARRTPAAGGMYLEMEQAFIKAQAAAADKENFQAELDEAMAEIIHLWEDANAATVINYCTTAQTVLNNPDATSDELAGAMHSYGEAVGFASGWRGLNTRYRTITDAQIDAVLANLEAPYGESASSYLFLTNRVPSQIEKLQAVIEELQGIYGFTAQEIAGFANNWVNVEERF